jgi:transposase
MSASVIMGSVAAPTRGKTRYFSAMGCVVEYPERRDVFVGGSLIGTFRRDERAMRNMLIVVAAQSAGVELKQLARAFGVAEETVRVVRRRFEAGGIKAIVEERKGREKKLTDRLVEQLSKLFDQGLTIDEAHKRVRARVSRAVVGRAHKRWVEAKKCAAEAAEQQEKEPAQLSLEKLHVRAKERRRARPGKQEEPPSAGTPSETSGDKPETGADPAVLHGGEHEHVQHLGAWIMLAMLNALGVYAHAEYLRAQEARELAAKGKQFVKQAALRLALDAAVIAFAIRERTVEGVRRIATASAATLLRHRAAVSASWVRRVLGRFAESTAEMLHMMQATVLVQQSERHARAQQPEEPRVVFYIDGHLRPYTGKFTIRKGWRMQDKRARPGVSDYWVHDEDGRPVMRVNSPEHASMVRRLRPIGTRLRDALEDESARVLMVFDRAGAFPAEMAELRDAGFEFVTYERGPYPELPPSAFEYSMKLGGEKLEFTEAPQKNLGKQRGRVRRIVLRTADGDQVNILAVSEAPAAQLIAYMLSRWSRQENQFKHGVERWGINQLDGRQVEEYPPDAIIPNPARRKIERTLRVLRAAEGEALRRLERTPADDPKYQRLQQDVQRSRAQQAELEELRPHVPKHAPVVDTELSGVLVMHKDRYKLVLDTLRIALANAESELAARLAPLLRKPKEAKKTLANLLAASGTLTVSQRFVTLRLSPAGTRSELSAFGELLDQLSHLPLTLPGDKAGRRIRFELQNP